MLRPATFLVTVTLAVVSVGCGCAASPERTTERAAPAQNRQEVWGASFSLPEGWSGGENDTGGYEFTDGEVALMVGRHTLDP